MNLQKAEKDVIASRGRSGDVSWRTEKHGIWSRGNSCRCTVRPTAFCDITLPWTCALSSNFATWHTASWWTASALLAQFVDTAFCLEVHAGRW